MKFWPRSSQPNYIHFVTIAGDVNYSYIGKIGGKQEIQISETGYLGNIIHEIGHALGLFHEHSRPDRDNYIRVLYENIKPQFHYAYDIEPSAGVSKIYYCCPVKLLL